MIHRCCFYGTLRKGQTGWMQISSLYGGSALEYLSTVSLPGFELFEFIRYSGAVCCRADNTSKVVFDMVRIKNDECFERICQFELTNYNVVHDTISIDDVFYSIFTYKIRPFGTERIISGDWLKKNFKQNEHDRQKDFTEHIDVYD